VKLIRRLSTIQRTAAGPRRATALVATATAMLLGSLAAFSQPAAATTPVDDDGDGVVVIDEDCFNASLPCNPFPDFEPVPPGAGPKTGSFTCVLNIANDEPVVTSGKCGDAGIQSRIRAYARFTRDHPNPVGNSNCGEVPTALDPDGDGVINDGTARMDRINLRYVATVKPSKTPQTPAEEEPLDFLRPIHGECVRAVVSANPNYQRYLVEEL
jgi:hypothetical protein